MKERMMKLQSKILCVAVSMLFLSPGLAHSQEGKKAKCPRKVKVEVAEVKGESFSEYAYLRSEIKPLTVELKAEVDAKVKEVLSRAGDEVKAGDVLVALDASLLDKEIKSAQAAVAQWERTLTSRRNWKERSEKAEKQAEEKLGEARAILTALQEKAERHLIKSGIDGRVEALSAESGMDAAAGTVLAVVVNEGVMKFTVSGDEVASLGDKVFVRFETLGSGMNGEVVATGPGQAEVVVDNRDRTLTAGLPATLKILKKEYSDVVVLKQEQVLRDTAGDYVYLAEKNRAKRAALTLGATEDGRVLVLAGLEKGGILISKGVECLYDGKKIKVVNKLPEKPAVKAEEKPVTAVVKAEEEPVQPEVKKEEVPEFPEAARPVEKRFKAGLNFEYRYMTGEGFSGLYGRALGAGIELSFRVSEKVDVWISASTSGKEQNLDWTDETTKYSMLPISAGVKYYVLQKAKLAAFVGGGLNFTVFKDTNPFGETKENVFGFNVLGGTHFKLSNALGAQAMLMFNSGKKTLDMIPEPDFPLDLTNVAMKFGIFFKF
jgi:RND family efflux transporter MFP subunit